MAERREVEVPGFLWFSDYRKRCVEWVREVEGGERFDRWSAFLDELREGVRIVEGEYKSDIAAVQGSSREVAGVAGVSHETVRKARARTTPAEDFE